MVHLLRKMAGIGVFLVLLGACSTEEQPLEVADSSSVANQSEELAEVVSISLDELVSFGEETVLPGETEPTLRSVGMSPLAWWGFGRGSAVRRATGVRLVV